MNRKQEQTFVSDRRNYEIQMQKSLIASGQFPTCTGCEFWNRNKEVCEKYNMKPPAEVIVTGCVNYESAIPF